MNEINIEGEIIKYSISRNVSLNRANPHRLVAFCICGEQFTQGAVSNNVYKEKFLRKWLTEDLKRHRANGYCKLGALE